MMNKMKTVFWGFFSLDYKSIAEYLEQMAEKGWMIKKIGRLTAQFSQIEPQKIKFYVDIFPGKGCLDATDPELLDYRHLCEESGWHFITAQAHLQIYYAYEGENPVPIQTDEEIEHKIVQGTLLKNEMIGIAISFFATFILFMIAVDYDYTNLLSFSGVAMMFAFPLTVIVIGALGIYIFTWMIKARHCINKGLVIPKSKLKTARLRSKAFFGAYFLIALIWIVSILGDLLSGHSYAVAALLPLILGGGAGYLIRRYKLARKTISKKMIVIIGIMITAVVVVTTVITMSTAIMLMNKGDKLIEELPSQYPAITLNDIYEKSDVKIKVSRFYKSRSPIVPRHFDYYEIAGEKKGSIFTEYYSSINEYFAGIIFSGKLEDELRYGEIIGVKDAGWNVDEMVYIDDYKTLLLRKGKVVIFIEGDFDLRQQKMKDLVQIKLLDAE